LEGLVMAFAAAVRTIVSSGRNICEGLADTLADSPASADME
jgi:hypothetical protein